MIKSDLEAGCPRCRYPVWIKYAEIVAQAIVVCPCCRRSIKLQDGEGSAQTLGARVQREIKRAFKDLLK